MSHVRTHIRQALGQEPADIVIRNVRVLDIAQGSFYTTDIGINSESGIIVSTEKGTQGRKVIDGTGFTAVPGFNDGHVHVESSMLTPLEFGRCVLRHGTTGAICDPHEIANVMGARGIEYVLESAQAMAMDLFVNVSTCVPATPLETSGAKVTGDDIVSLLRHPKAIQPAEFMDIGGVAGQSDETIDKAEKLQGYDLDGHLPPGIHGRLLEAMAVTGVSNCHETCSLDHAHEKLRKGIQVFARAGDGYNNVPELATLFTPMTSPFLGFCTDDRSPSKIAEDGHMDFAVREAIKNGADPVSAYRAASWSVAQNFGLHKNTAKWRKRGKIAPGWQADILLMEGDIRDVKVHTVIKSGKVVNDETFEARPHVAPIGYGSIHVKDVTAADFAVKHETPTIPVIDIIDNSPMTEFSTHTLPVGADGTLQRDMDSDILKIAVLERHGKNGNIGRWFARGFGIKDGAIASSVGHDSHNITVVGATDEDMAVAVNRMKEIGGGFVVVKNGKVLGELPLPVAGLMSDKTLEDVRQAQKILNDAVHALNPGTPEPLARLIFMSLSVIPKLKLTDFGPVRFDPANGDNAPVLIADQRMRAPAA